MFEERNQPNVVNVCEMIQSLRLFDFSGSSLEINDKAIKVNLWVVSLQKNINRLLTKRFEA